MTATAISLNIFSAPILPLTNITPNNSESNIEDEIYDVDVKSQTSFIFST